MNTQAIERWAPGDRLPDVRLQARDGERPMLHARFAGRPLWLCIPSDAAIAAGLPQLPEDVTGLCLGRDFFDAPARWQSCVTDPGWCRGLSTDELWIADANLRLQSRHAMPWQAGGWSAPTPVVLDVRQTAMLAPILQIPDVFEPALCARLIEHLEVDCGGGDTSGVLVLEAGKQEYVVDPEIKQRRESTPRDPQLEALMHACVSRRVLPEIDRVFNFRVARRDAFKLLAYPEHAGFFRAHRDNETADVAHRRFALSINLNAGEYDGGEFRYPEFGLHRYSPATGSAIVFSCALLHEVLPVTRGLRYAMTTFLA